MASPLRINNIFFIVKMIDLGSRIEIKIYVFYVFIVRPFLVGVSWTLNTVSIFVDMAVY